MKLTKEVSIGDQTITFETGQLAKQADGSVLVQLGETIVLTAVVGARSARPGQSWFPLTVDYREKAAAAGRFPGGYFKREGRPNEKEILTCRLTDRPIRPLFPKGYMNEVQIQSMVLSADGQNDADILSILGASVALMVSDIPWAGPLGAVRVGRVDGSFVVNPTHAQREDSDLDLIYVGNKTDVVMFEGSADEIPEADFCEALKFAQEACQPLITAQEELAAEIGVTKRDYDVVEIPEDVENRAMEAFADSRLTEALRIQEKLPRERAVSEVKGEMTGLLVEEFGEEEKKGFKEESARRAEVTERVEQ